MKTILSVDDLSAGYGESPVFEHISFDVKENEIFGLVGLNGTGKTTLIKTVLGLRNPIQGRVSIGGDAVGSTERKKNFAYLPERFDPPWFLNGYEFIKFSLELYGLTITREAVDKAADSVSLSVSFLKKRVGSYSKGMRQKLGLLATVLTQCPLIILDEPMSGLDPKARHDVKELILNVKKQDKAVFMCSHILSDIGELCDKVAVMHGQEFVFIGSPDEMARKGENDNLEKSFLNIIHLSLIHI